MVFIASPYWHENKSIRDKRRKQVTEYAHRLAEKGIKNYCPLAYSEGFPEVGEGYWIEHGLEMIKICNMVIVYCLQGWEKSKGIKGEVKKAEKLGIPVCYAEGDE